MGQDWTDRAVEKYLAYFREMRQAYEAQSGLPLELYKATEPVCVEQTFSTLAGLSMTGATFLSEMLHRLVWAQCLGNANHRTSVLFVRTFLEREGVPFPAYESEAGSQERFLGSLNEWIQRSQPLIRRRGEPGYAQARLEPEHRTITTRWLEENLGPQSEPLAMIGAQRLIAFFS